MEKQTKNYEIGFLTVNESDVNEVIRDLEAHKAEILNQGRPRKIRLAYPIKKEIVSFFTFVQFAMDSDMVEAFQNKLKLNNKILRFMVVNLPAIALKQEKQSEKPVESVEKPTATKLRTKPAETKKASSDDFVNNELLEKKLEEILK